MDGVATEMLKQLGAGIPIAAVCKTAGWTRAEFDQWWRECVAKRVPVASGDVRAAVKAAVSIQRDQRGIPHIHAENDEDLFVGLGYAMAQDRLFQLDYLRRKGAGSLAEVLGVEALQSDLLARTVGLRRIAETEWRRLPETVQTLLTSFTAGINAVIEQSTGNLPIEFDLLDYRPAPWTEIDCLTIESDLRWYLTGRFPVIVIPELVKRSLGDGDLRREFHCGEALDEYLLPPDGYPKTRPERTTESIGPPMGGFDDGTGSNNWVVGGKLTESGKPLVASDPHIAIEAVSCWYQAHLHGGSFNVAGMTHVGMPAIMFGRNEKVAWGITNNICSIRDLYQEKTDPDHPGCFLFNGQWEPWRERTEEIVVRHAEPVTKTVRFSRNGPIVDELLPSPADKTGPVSLRWLGNHEGGWLTALLGMDRARNVADFNESLRPWHVPTFSLVFADTEGHIGLKISGRIPVRNIVERGYRPGYDPAHQWGGLISFEDMPGVIDPDQGFAATANNPLATTDYPYPLSCTAPAGYRARHIREMIESHEPATINSDDFRNMQFDVLSLRAVNCLPPLLAILDAASEEDERTRSAIDALSAWDGNVLPKSIGPTVFNVFFTYWTRTVVAARFDEDARPLVAMGAEGLAARLLAEDQHGWFAGGDRDERVRAAFQQALADLTQRLGPSVADWQWERLHRLTMGHVLASRGDLAELLNYAGMGVRGDMQSVCNTGSGPDWSATTGGGFRMIADLSDSTTLRTVDAPSQSGHPGSPHYEDQLDDWLAGSYHDLPLARERNAVDASLTLQPGFPSAASGRDQGGSSNTTK
ncbi:MAG: penicillin acylase family protein [Pirellulaceae bacterium]|nr:penicillin acylase family protein [Pirellulaceae bacterium]MDP6554917.1 penicillin acylase family protein [Pirellulaceae bacterium]